ncbi:MAG TPA: hypothetical protein VM935_01670 [Chitinophagaceae bacterium]|nr:hypothetical protein [Chitinophagaceae bacterium]
MGSMSSTLPKAVNRCMQPERVKAINMRQGFMLLLYVFLLKNSFAQADSISTRIIIIGTVHKGSGHISHKGLFKELKTLKPDVILSEESTPFKKVFGLRTAHFLRIWKPSIEQLAVQKYTSKYSNCVVLPFDTLIKERHKYKRDLQIKTKAVFDTLLKAKLTTKDSITFSNYFIKSTSYYEIIFSKSLKELNEKYIIDKSRELYQIDKDSIKHLVIKYCSDPLLTKWYLDDQIFWELRNMYMARQIRTTASEFRGKKILVLTGLNHKYFLLDELSKYQDARFTPIAYPN